MSKITDNAISKYPVIPVDDRSDDSVCQLAYVQDRCRKAYEEGQKEMLDYVKQWFDEYVLSVAYLPHRYSSITLPKYGHEIIDMLVKEIENE